MKNLLFIVFLGSTVTKIMAQSHSVSCSMVNGKWTCREMKDPQGDSAFSSSVSFSGPGGNSSTYEDVATGSRDGFNFDQGGTGIFSDANSRGGSGIFPGMNPTGGFGIYSGMNPYSGAGIFTGASPSDGTDKVSDSDGASESEDGSPLSADDSEVYPEDTEPPISSPPVDGVNFRPFPMGPRGTFTTAGSGPFPRVFNPFTGTRAFPRFPFGGPRAFAGAGPPFINSAVVPGFPFGRPRAFAGAGSPFINYAGFPHGLPFGGARAVAYAGRRK